MKKKIFSFILVAIMFILLVACESANSEKIKVNFDTNGGSTIESVEIGLNDVSTFKLPANPTLEGYDFKGWYLDKEFTNEFKNVDITSGELTLYAKWEKAKTPEEVNQEKLAGSWAGVASQVTFNKDNTCTLALGELKIEGTYTVDALGNVAFDIKGTPVTINAKLENKGLNINLMNQNFTLSKIPTLDFSLIDLPFDFEALEGTDFERKFNFKFNLNLWQKDYDATEEALRSNPEAEDIYKDNLITIELDYTAKVQLEKILVNDVKDIKAAFDFKGEFIASNNGKEVTDEDYLTFKKAFEHIYAYINEGYLYIYFNKPVETEQQITEGDVITYNTLYSNEEKYYKINLEEVIARAKARALEEYESDEVQGMLDQLPVDLTGEVNLQTAVEKINEGVSMAFSTIYSMGISMEKIEELYGAIKGLQPVVKEEGNTITYTVDKDELINALSNLKTFISENKDLIIMINDLVGDEPMTVQDFNDLIKDLEEYIEEIKNAFDIKSFDICFTKDGNKIVGVSDDVDFTIYLANENKTFINFFEKGELKVNKTDVKIEFPDFTDYKDISDDILPEE